MGMSQVRGIAVTRRLVAALFLTGSLAACSFAPKYVTPDLPVPAHFPSGQELPASVAVIGWEDFFREPQLRSLIGQALANNRDVRIAAARIEEARAAYRIQGSALYPQLNAVGRGTRARTPADLSMTGQAQSSDQIYAQLSAGWEIDFWGRLANLKAAARAQYLASEEGWRGVVTSLIAQVANGYWRERELTERLALARSTTDGRVESVRIIRRRYDVGAGSKLELVQAETLLAQARTAAQALEQERETNRNALALLVGAPVEIGPGSLQQAEAQDDRPLAAGLPSELLAQRPDIIAAEQRLRAANANIGVARAAFFPNISLTGAFGTASAELDGLFATGSQAWSFTPVITLPLFQGGRNIANLDLAKARRNIAVADYERTVQGAFRDVADALVQRRQLAEQIASMRDMVAALTERARLARLRFDNGRSAYLEVLDAERDLFQSQQSLVQLRRAYLASGAALYAALGGGIAAKQQYAPQTAVAEERK